MSGRREAYVWLRTDPVGTGFGHEIRLGLCTDYPPNGLDPRRSGARGATSRRVTINQEYLYFLFQLRGSLLVEQAGRAALATPGSLVIYDSATPFTLRTKE